VDIERCLLLGEQASEALAAVRSQARSLGAGGEIDLQAGAEGAHLAVRPRAPLAADTVVALFEAWSASGIAGASIPDDQQAPLAFGAADVDVSEPGGPPLRIPAGGFAQVGRAANAALVAAVMQAVGDDPGDVLELYAGSGNFTRHLLARSKRVVAHDADGPAVARGRRNAAGALWHQGRLPAGREGLADTVLVDPPREGLDGENFAAAARARRRLVYVSCDPQTLGRDAAKLRAQGFTLRRAVALDLMPQTFHVEVVATFDRS
jgi:23S rRNA (uracil1939-C5)-methyltransferase